MHCIILIKLDLRRGKHRRYSFQCSERMILETIYELLVARRLFMRTPAIRKLRWANRH